MAHPELLVAIAARVSEVLGIGNVAIAAEPDEPPPVPHSARIMATVSPGPVDMLHPEEHAAQIAEMASVAVNLWTAVQLGLDRKWPFIDAQRGLYAARMKIVRGFAGWFPPDADGFRPRGAVVIGKTNPPAVFVDEARNKTQLIVLTISLVVSYDAA